MTDLGPLNIPLTATGISEVISSFQKLESAVERAGKSSRAMLQVMKNESKARLEAAKAATAEAKAKEKGAKQSADVEKAQALEVIRVKRETEREATRIAKQESGNRLRIIEKEARDHKRLMKSMVGAGVRGASNFVNTAARWGGAALALGGGFSIAGALDHERQIHQQATSLSVATNIPGGTQITPQQAIAKAKGLASEYNLNAEDILGGAHQFIARGGTPATNSLNDVLPEMAKIAKAEDVDPTVLGEAMGIALKQNPSLNSKELIGLMNVLVAQGKSGSVELRQLAPNLARTLASATLYSGNQLDNQIKLAALAQKATATAGGPEEAATDVGKFGISILKHQKLFKAAGIETLDNKGNLLSVETLLKNIFTKTGTNPAKIEKLFPDKGGLRLLEAFLPDIKKFGLDEAMKQFTATFHEYLTEEDKAKDLATKQNDDIEKFDKVMKDLERELGTALVPVIKELTPHIKDLTPQVINLFKGVSNFVGWAASHPWLAAFDGLGLAVSKAIVGQIIKSEISSSFSGVGLKAGLLAGAIGAAILTIQYYTQQLEESRKSQTDALKDADAVDKQFTDKMKRGEVSADDIKKYGKNIQVGEDQAKQQINDLGLQPGDKLHWGASDTNIALVTELNNRIAAAEEFKKQAAGYLNVLNMSSPMPPPNSSQQAPTMSIIDQEHAKETADQVGDIMADTFIKSVRDKLGTEGLPIKFQLNLGTGPTGTGMTSPP